MVGIVHLMSVTALAVDAPEPLDGSGDLVGPVRPVVRRQRIRPSGLRAKTCASARVVAVRAEAHATDDDEPAGALDRVRCRLGGKIEFLAGEGRQAQNVVQLAGG